MLRKQFRAIVSAARRNFVDSKAFLWTPAIIEDRAMPARPRQSTKASNDASKRAAIASAVSTEIAEPVPEVRLLGTLYPAPSREERIAISAYWRAAKRQFSPGHELDDWLAAEREIDDEVDSTSERNDK